jgi:LysM repeat protein
MKTFFLLSVALVCLGLASCKKSESSSGSAHIAVKLTDDPGPYNAVILSIKSVVVTTSSGEHTLAVGGGPIDILRFRFGKDTLLAAQDIPAGTIQQVRLVLNATGNRVVVNGTSYDLNTPSGQTSGVKLNVHDNLTAGINYTLRLDFDAARSIVTTGNGKYQLKPVIRAIADAVSGALTGTVSPAMSYPKVYAIMGTDTVGTVADATGKFYFPGLAAGIYSVKFLPVSPYAVKTVNNVSVTNGSVQDMGTVTITP